MSNESAEMYLETVYILENSHGHAHVAHIAKHLGVSKPSVSKAVEALKEQGFVDKEKYGTITLTPKGRELSEKIYNNHQLIAEFLEMSLGLSADEASKNACRIEHILSNEMLEAIKNYVKENKNKS